MKSLELKVLIADDEFGMRMVLRKAIEKIEGFKITGEAENGEALLEMVEIYKPNVIFLDVEMPKINGIECSKKIIDINPKTIIIFATAHGEFTSEAFEVYAFDYIVKPFKVDRIYNTLNRIKNLSNGDEGNASINKIVKKSCNFGKLLIKNKDGMSFIDMEDIIIIQRENKSTVIYTENSSFITSEGLCELEEKLDSSQFFRSHKSYIINLSMIYKINPYGRWTYTIKLKNTDKDALITYEKYEELKNMFQ